MDRAAARARDSGGGGARQLGAVLEQYVQLLGVQHLALMAHRLSELQQQGLAGAAQEVEALAGQLFAASTPLLAAADANAATLSSLLGSCAELGLYSSSVVSACVERCRAIMQRQVAAGPAAARAAGGFSPRQLSGLLHSLAVLGLRPSDEWLSVLLRLSGALAGG